MKLKENLEVSTDDFWYDISNGGYIKPEEMCENPEDAKRIIEAIKTLQEFKESCENQIEGFIR